MDTSKLKKFAQFARRALITQVSAKLESVVAENSAARREHPDAMRKLEAAIAKDGKDQVVERVAYTWFNRFSALRFMDLNELNQVRVVSPVSGQFQPEILAEAKAGHMDEGRVPDRVREQVRSLLDGRTPSSDAQTEAYRLLIVAVCNDLHKAMPFLFERIDDYTELLLPDDLLSNSSILAYVREAMTPDVCEDVEVIGWLYQFYISEKKDEVFAGLKKNKKITAENIPAATQLFTPHWIVRYLVENSLGRLWLLNHPNSRLAEQMDYYVAPEESETDFLRISRPEDIRLCDPACGSGHMLTYAFDLLYAIYEEEGYEATEIPGLILTHNLYGIEIDDRAGALAAFALAMKAATKLGRRRFLREAAQPKICVLQDVRFTPSEMQDVAAVVGSDLFTAEFRETMGQFEQAKNFGSLIVPKLRDPAEVARVVRLKDFGGDLLLRDVQERVLKVLEMAEALSPKYHVVVANPPYAGASGLNPALKTWTSENYPSSKADLFAMFIERCLSLSERLGLAALINMPSWMFLSAYEKLRLKILRDASILTLAHIGERGFDTIGGAVVSTVAFVMRKQADARLKGSFFRLVSGRGEAEKSSLLLASKNNPPFRVSSDSFKALPGSPIAYWLPEGLVESFKLHPQVAKFARAAKGLVTANNERFVRFWFEVARSNLGFGYSRDEAKRSGLRWFPYAKGGEARRWFGNFDSCVDWFDDGYQIQNELTDDGSRVRATNFNLDRIFKSGISWTVVTTSDPTFRIVPDGYLFDAASGIIQAKGIREQVLLGALNSKVSKETLAAINPTLNLHPGYLESIPLAQPEPSEQVCRRIDSLVNISRTDWNASETSWDFSTLPLLEDEHKSEAIAVSYSRLRKEWQRMTDELKALVPESKVHAG